MSEFIYGLIIGADPAITRELAEHSANIESALYLRSVSEFADEAELESSLRIHAPSIVFLDMTDLPLAEYICAVIRRLSPLTQVIGYTTRITNSLLLAAVRCSLRDVLEIPLSEQTIRQALARSIEQLRISANLGPQPRRNQIHCFLPGKIGCGASTVALHTAAAMSRVREQRVSLIDMDFDCGAIDFMLNLPFGQGLEHLRDYGSRLDESVWSRVVNKVGNLDVVRNGSRGQGIYFHARDVKNLMGYARASYNSACIDLPGSFNEHSLTALEYCDSIVLVCTPELPTVHMTRRRIDFLRELGLSGHVRVVLNREKANGAMTRSEIEEVLQTEIFATLGNDYPGLQKAILNGRPMDNDTVLGRQFAEIARRLSGEGHAASHQRPSIWAGLRNWMGWSDPKATSRVAPGTQLLLPPPTHPSRRPSSSEFEDLEQDAGFHELSIRRTRDGANLNGSAWVGD